MENTPALSLFDRIGGDAAVAAAIPIFYRKVLADDRIKGFFEGISIEHLMAHQKAFLTMALGGSKQYTGRGMRAAHAGLVARGLNESHFNAVAENLVATLKELGVQPAEVDEIVAIVLTTKNDVLGL
jgi:hemoglobin